MNEVFEENLLNEYKEAIVLLNNEAIEDDGILALLLAIVLKEDSLFNCLVKTDYEIVIDLIVLLHDYYNEVKAINDCELVIDLANEICIKDRENKVADEHLLYGIVYANIPFYNRIFNELSIDMSDIKVSIDSYFELDDNEYLVNLSELARLNKFNPFIGRSEYIDKIIRIISKKQKNNCLLIGSAGVGKSALVEGVATELIKRQISITLYRLELGVIIAGTRYRGDLEERLINVIKKVKNEKAILFIDEIHNIVGGSKGEDSINIANILKPILARSEIKCIGATTIDEYYEYIDKDKALCRRFQTIFIPEASKEETLKILRKIKYKYEEFYKIRYSDYIIKCIINNCIYFPNRKFPDKAIDIMDELGAYTISKNELIAKEMDIKKIVFENIGLKLLKSNSLKKVKYQDLNNYYKLFINKKISDEMNERKTIINIRCIGNNYNEVIEDIKILFNLNNEAIIKLDFELFDEYAYNVVISSVLKFPIVCIVINNFIASESKYILRFQKIIDNGYVFDSVGRIVSFKNTIFILQDMFERKNIGFNKANNSYNSNELKYFYDIKITCNDNVKEFSSRIIKVTNI